MKDFIEKIVALDNIKQWEERDSVIKETVSQHSFKVSAICLYILEHIGNSIEFKNDFAWNKFAFKCLEYAVLHDFDEAILGRDISHVVKYNKHNGDKIREQLNEYVHFQLKNLGMNFVNDDIDPDIKSFVKLCDWLSMLSFIIRNKKMGVNTFEFEERYCVEKSIESVNVVSFMLSNRFGNRINNEFFKNIINDYING